MRRLRYELITVVLVLTLLVAGCPTDAYRVSVKLGDDVAQGVNKGIPIVDTLRRDRLIDFGEERNVLLAFSRVTDLNTTYLSRVAAIRGQQVACQQSPPPTGCDYVSRYLDAASGFADDFAKPSTLVGIGVKNPQAQARVETIINSIRTVIDGAKLAIARIKGGGK